MQLKGIIRMPALIKIVGLSRATIWRRVKSGNFPPPVRLGGPGSRAVGWRSNEIDYWVQHLPKA